MKSRYLIQSEGDVEPILHGPYSSDKERDDAALKMFDKNPGKDSFFKLDNEDNIPTIDSYSGGFMWQAPEYIPEYDAAGNYSIHGA